MKLPKSTCFSLWELCRMVEYSAGRNYKAKANLCSWGNSLPLLPKLPLEFSSCWNYWNTKTGSGWIVREPFSTGFSKYLTRNREVNSGKLLNSLKSSKKTIAEEIWLLEDCPSWQQCVKRLTFGNRGRGDNQQCEGGVERHLQDILYSLTLICLACSAEMFPCHKRYHREYFAVQKRAAAWRLWRNETDPKIFEKPAHREFTPNQWQ